MAFSQNLNVSKQASSLSLGALWSSSPAVGSLLLVLLAGDHVSLGHVERRGVTVGVRRVLEQHRVVVLRLRTHARCR